MKKSFVFTIIFISVLGSFLCLQRSSSIAQNNVHVTQTNPPDNGNLVSSDFVIEATFSDSIDATSVNGSTFVVRGEQSGIYSGTISVFDNVIQFRSFSHFRNGEDIVVSVDHHVTSNSINIQPYIWQFQINVEQTDALFVETGENTDDAINGHMGDVDNDGDLDIFKVNGNNLPNIVWLNDGSGVFSDSGQRLGNSTSAYVDLGDLDSDGDLDAFVVNWERGRGSPDKVWLNNGDGIFSDSGQLLGDAGGFGVALGDLDLDGDLDAYVANSGPGTTGYDTIWFNNGSAEFTLSQTLQDSHNSQGVALGDIDSDGDIDVFVANQGNDANQIWLNDGTGNLVSGFSLGNQWSESVALGDVDLDGDLDAFVVNESSHPTTGSALALQGESDEIWINDGVGNFTKSTQALASSNGEEVALGDVDGDGDIDALVGNRDSGSDLYLNDGTGLFSLHQIFGTRGHNHVDLGDIDGDGDLDAISVGIWVNRDRYKLFLPVVTN